MGLPGEKGGRNTSNKKAYKQVNYATSTCMNLGFESKNLTVCEAVMLDSVIVTSCDCPQHFIKCSRSCCGSKASSGVPWLPSQPGLW